MSLHRYGSVVDTNTAEIIEEILQGCSDHHELYRRVMFRTAWRVQGDFSFIKAQIPHVKSVLDVGAIPPLLAGLLVQSGIQYVTVIDSNAEVFKSYFESVGITHIQGEILSADLEPLHRHFDLVCLCEVVEHLAGDVLLSVERVANCVTPGGYFYITTPNLKSISGALAIFICGSGLASKPHETVRAQYERAASQGGYYGHVREYTEKEIIDLVESMGFIHVKSSFQVRPRAQTRLEKCARFLEHLFPRLRLFGQYLFKKQR